MPPIFRSLMVRCSFPEPVIHLVRNSGPKWKTKEHVLRSLGTYSAAAIISESFDPVHPVMQHRYTADVAVRQPSPVNDMVGGPEVEAIDPELGQNRARCTGDAR
jgi:hypothetical protein